MERILQNTTATLTGLFQVDGVNTDPSPATATVRIVNTAGTEIQAATAATRTAVGTFTFNLNTTHTAALDRLTAYWTSSLGTITTTVEVVGGFYFTIAEFTARYTDVTGYTTAQIADARKVAEDAYEDAIGYACVPRFAYNRSVGAYGTTLHLAHRYIRSVTSATDSSGTAVTISSALYDDSAFVDMAGWWGTGHPLRVAYTHGKDAPDAVDKNAVMILARHYLVGSNGVVDDRAASIATEPGIIDLTVWPREVNRIVSMRRIPSVA